MKFRIVKLETEQYATANQHIKLWHISNKFSGELYYTISFYHTQSICYDGLFDAPPTHLLHGVYLKTPKIDWWICQQYGGKKNDIHCLKASDNLLDTSVT